ncbi:hypothetical protein [Planococcus sp. YIM B11945]|uniref:hypothetical protein n=1 Tax=Planococcus sp. YIM B11945 TaxID=3435410 RepID=UPI003D7E454D
MAIYFFTFEALPKLDNPEIEEFEGAFVNCWVHSIDLNLAFAEARNYINEEGWKIIRLDSQYTASRELYENDPELLNSLNCFDEAVEYGVSAIFHTWPYEEI